jgi:beta-1,4-mannosyltransferase
VTAEKYSRGAELDALHAASRGNARPDDLREQGYPDSDGDAYPDVGYTDPSDAERSAHPHPSADPPGSGVHPRSGYGQPGYPEPAYTQPAYSQPGYSDTGYSDTGYSDTGYSEPAYSEPAYSEPGYGEPGNQGQPGYSEPAYQAQPGYPAQPGLQAQAGYRYGLTTQPGTSLAAGSRQSGHLRDRLSRWKPRFLPLILSFILVILVIGWFTGPDPGLLGWPVTILWSWPILDTLIGIRGIRRTRRILKQSRARWGDKDTICEDYLVVVVPTIGRHDTYPALERSVLTFIRHLPGHFPLMRVDLITEEGCEAADRIDALASRSGLIRVVVVPKRYRTQHGTRFKARANHYAHELRIYEGEDRDDVWVLHMDDDTGVGPDTALAMARFIEEQYRAGANAKHMAQGILTYPRELAVSRVTWLADAVRPAHDVSRFAAWTGGGTPRAGLHGELLLLRASVEATIGWDFGPRSIVEDAHFALIYSRRYKGKSAWFAGRCYGASPASISDFLRQRERWSWGLAGLAFNRSLSRRSRAYIGYSVLTSALGPIQNIAVILGVGALMASDSTVPTSLFVLPVWALNMAFAVWMYWEGLRLNAGVSLRGRRRFWEPPVLVLLIPFFAMLEGLGGARGFIKFVFRAENRFVVIAKPT